jgi:hypothetical protein
MLTEDYIMRMINQALAVFLAALGLKRAGQFNQALQSFDQAQAGLLGLDSRLADQLDDRALLDILSPQGNLDVERSLMLADICGEKAEIYAQLKESGHSQVAAQRSLRLYLEAALVNKTYLDVELIQKIEKQRIKISSPTLPLETRLALLDYFETLLKHKTDMLDNVGLTQAEILEAFADLQRLNPS